ncbi:MAG TPA: polysaccharide biosynthesis tyrosine autokinase [Chitinophagaceae bacterium]|nr:polysaccharide biosynthesis tyrosine autokinase [Chitinophagaceae bacterium]
MLTNNKPIVENESEENLIQQVVSKYLPYWPMFIAAIVIAGALGYLYLRYTTPIYQATATILIKDEKKGNEDSKIMESLDQISSKKIVENEIEILQSRTIMEAAVKDLGLYAPVSETGTVHSISAYVTSPVVVRVPDPDSLKPQPKIFLSYNKDTKTVWLNSKYEYPLNQIVSTPFGYLEFLPNKYFRPSDTATHPLYFSLQDPKSVASGLIANLVAEPSGKLSSVIDLSYLDEVRQRAEDILNAILKAYDKASIDEKDQLARNTMAFVADRLNAVAHDLDSIQKKVQQYKSGQGAVDLGVQGQLYLQNVSANDQKLGEINMQLAALEKIKKVVTSNDNNGVIALSTLGVTDAQLSPLLDKLNTEELNYTRLKKTMGENHPSLVQIADQINQLKPSILQNIESEEQNLSAEKQNLSATNSGYNGILQAVPQKERELLDISREEATKNSIYAFLLQKKEESELAYASTVSDHQIVDTAQVGELPVKPKPMIIYLAAIVACLGLCFVIITIKDSLTGKVLYRQEIESRTSIPIIGEVAFDKSKNPLVIQAGTRSFIAEEFRKLRISLSFLGINDDHKKILVTSSISGEGKSFIAANLAVSLSLTGKKVVLVDLDLNNPTIAKILNITPEDGISEFLKGEKDPEEIIKRVKAHENLFFISSGSLPEDPTELLANGKVKEMIDYLDNIFDIIVIDTSPIVLVTDGYLLTGLCDATLYVVRHKYTPKILIKRMNETNRINPIKNPAIIFNGVKVRGFFKNNYGYGYDYVYGSKNRVYKKSMINK